MIKEPYQPRRIAFVDIAEVQGWQLKRYSILYGDKTLNDQVVTAARNVAADFLPQPATAPSHYGVGFVSVHQGKSYDFVTLAYWTYDTELRHQSYMRPSSSSAALAPVTSELSSDVWDLRLLAFEREAWINTVLSAAEPDLSAYLKTTLSETV